MCKYQWIALIAQLKSHVRSVCPYPQLHGSGLRYEIGIGIESVDMVWANGPFQFGQQNDVLIFDRCLNEKLSNELVMADRIYRHLNCVNPRNVYHD